MQHDEHHAEHTDDAPPPPLAAAWAVATHACAGADGVDGAAGGPNQAGGRAKKKGSGLTLISNSGSHRRS